MVSHCNFIPSLYTRYCSLSLSLSLYLSIYLSLFYLYFYQSMTSHCANTNYSSTLPSEYSYSLQSRQMDDKSSLVSVWHNELVSMNITETFNKMAVINQLNHSAFYALWGEYLKSRDFVCSSMTYLLFFIILLLSLLYLFWNQVIKSVSKLQSFSFIL